MTRLFHRLVRAGSLLLACASIAAPAVPVPLAAAPQFVLPPIRHVFTIVLENQSYNSTFGTSLPVPYLAQDIAGHGALLQQYYATSHVSLGNYITLISGQAVTRDTQDDCAFNAKFPKFSANYANINVTRIAAFNQVAGSGCIYPAATKTVADQLTAAGFTWHGYMEDMGNDPTREAATCGQPSSGIGAPDITTNAQAPPLYNGRPTTITDQYAAKHNPFVYFHSLLDSGACKKNVDALGTPQKSPLVDALQSIATTPNYVFITPNLCDDGHDLPCKLPGSPTGDRAYEPENTFLQTWVPLIVRSPAFQRDGLLIITFDEASLSGTSPSGVYVGYDGSGCCNEPTGPNTKTPGYTPLSGAEYLNSPITAGTTGISGGGRIGTVLVSPFIKPGTVSAIPYNHYYTLRTVEDIFGLGHLGYAGYRNPATLEDTRDFGSDVFGSTIEHNPVVL